MRSAASGAALAGALLVAASLPGIATAQSIDECMEAAPARALSLCRTLIDEGRDNADVWTQLALSLDKSGRGADARTTIDEALRRYPRDADLLALRERLAARGSEEEQLRQAARRNPTAMAQGELKLLCRTRDGVAAIEACRRYLDMTDVDGERIRARLAELERAQPSVARAPAPEPQVRPSVGNAPTIPVTPSPDVPAGPELTPTPTPEPTPEPEPPAGPPIDPPGGTLATPGADTAAPADNSLARVERPAPAADPDAARRRARVVSIQRALDALGLSAGTPDGIAGPRTRQALARFDSLTGQSGSTLDETTLAALEAELPRLESAEATLATSRAAARAGRFDEASALLARAEGDSALLRVPPDYRAELERGRRLALEADREADADAEAEARRRAEAERLAAAEAPDAPDGPGTPDARPAAERPATAASSAPGGDVPGTLLMRIGALERRLTEAARTMREDAVRLREQVQRTLARP